MLEFNSSFLIIMLKSLYLPVEWFYVLFLYFVAMKWIYRDLNGSKGKVPSTPWDSCGKRSNPRVIFCLTGEEQKEILFTDIEWS